MKRFFLLSFLLVISMVTITAQTNLFKGITSGMIESELISHIKSQPDLMLNETQSENFSTQFKTEIEGREYACFTFFNDKGKLKGIGLYSLTQYEWVYYDPNVKENAVELFTLLSAKYGEPTYNEWLSWTEIPDGKEKVVCAFEMGTTKAIMSVQEYNEDYYVTLHILDNKFDDPEKPADSGGF